MKNIRGMVRDLAFAHLNQRVILAFTDHYGTLYVCEVSASSTEGSLEYVVLMLLLLGSLILVGDFKLYDTP